eukprot:comp5991_c0_seq1/m.1836 comp5991_c0_seq1/g.1836  ORF comp5991_c0_seq1/g.1836 comp5991_c0_seq1/m.1836 type:complete len:385 (-) comp5991_c0_seq1:118-1272(-)
MKNKLSTLTMYMSSPRARTLARTVTRYLTHYAGNDARRSPNGGRFIPLERIAWSDTKASPPTPPNTPLLSLQRRSNRTNSNNNTNTPTLMSLSSQQTEDPYVDEVGKEFRSLPSAFPRPAVSPQRGWILSTPPQVHQVKPGAPTEPHSTESSTQKLQPREFGSVRKPRDSPIFEIPENVPQETRNEYETQLGDTPRYYVLPRVHISSGCFKTSTEHEQAEPRNTRSESATVPHANAKVLLRSRSLPAENENEKSPKTNRRFTGRTSPVLARQLSAPQKLTARRNSLGNPPTFTSNTLPRASHHQGLHNAEPLALGNISHPRHRAAKLLADTASNGQGWMQNYLKAYWVLSTDDSRTLASVSVSADILGSRNGDTPLRPRSSFHV